jgi:hypothetical protein
VESDKTEGETFTAAANSFTAPEGYQFSQWNTAADGTGTGYAAGATVTMPGNDLVLYAIWEVVQEPYPAPVLNSVGYNGGYLLSWNLPENPTGTPAGGYDIIIDGVDTGTAWRTTSTSQTITGLNTSVTHTFQVESRWTQADPDEYPRSNVLTVAAAFPSPVLNSVEYNGGYLLTWGLPDNPTGTPTGGYDIIIDGIDTGATWRTTGTSQTITGLNTSVSHTFQVESRWTQASPAEYPRSNVLSIAAVDPYPAPVLNSAEPDGSSYVLNWSLPGNPTGIPAGGYDIIIDGFDTGTTWRTTFTSQTITGLDTSVTHTFQVESRWTQADPDEYPRSNELTLLKSASIVLGSEGQLNVPTVFRVYPNPFTGYVNVENADRLSRIIITNVAGQRVKDISSPASVIQLGDLTGGVYFMTLITSEGVVVTTVRIIK